MFLPILSICLCILAWSCFLGGLYFFMKNTNKQKRRHHANGSSTSSDCHIQFKINGKMGIALIDTGAKINVLTSEFAQTLNLNKKRYTKKCVNLVGIGGSVKSRQAINLGIVIGEEKMDCQFTILPFSNTYQPHDAILGCPFLKKYGLVPDIVNNELRSEYINVEMFPVEEYEVDEDFDDGNLYEVVHDENIYDNVADENDGYEIIENQPFTGRLGEGKKGGKILLYDSRVHENVTYTFCSKRVNADGDEAYRCTECEKTRSKRKIAGEELQPVTTIKGRGLNFFTDPDAHPHQCIQNENYSTTTKSISTQYYRQYAKKQRENPTAPSISYSQLNSQILRENPIHGLAIARELPAAPKVKRVLRLNAAHTRPGTMNPKNIPESLKHSPVCVPHINRNLIVRYAAEGENDRPFVIMMDHINLRTIHDATDLIFDGTFRVRPAGFEQVYTMHASYHNLPDYSRNFVVGIAFLPNKDIPTYTRLFTTIRNELVSEFGDIGQPKVCHFDHEEAAFAAMRETFPEWTLHSCYFHFYKNITSKMGQALMGNAGIQKWIHELLGSCHLPPILQNRVIGYLFLPENIPFVPQQNQYTLDTFMLYFNNFWLGKMAMVNFYGKGGVRTTNVAEGFHNALRTLIPQNRPEFAFAFHSIKDILSQSAIEFDKSNYGTDLLMRNAMLRRSEASIIRATNLITAEYNARRPIQMETLLKFCRHVCLHSTPRANNQTNRDFEFNIRLQEIPPLPELPLPSIPPFQPRPIAPIQILQHQLNQMQQQSMQRRQIERSLSQPLIRNRVNQQHYPYSRNGHPMQNLQQRRNLPVQNNAVAQNIQQSNYHQPGIPGEQWQNNHFDYFSPPPSQQYQQEQNFVEAPIHQNEIDIEMGREGRTFTQNEQNMLNLSNPYHAPEIDDFEGFAYQFPQPYP